MALFAFPLARGLSVGGLSWSQSSLWQPSLVIAPICHGHSPNTNTLPHHKLSILNTQSAQDNRNPFPEYNSSLNYFLRLKAVCQWMRTTLFRASTHICTLTYHFLFSEQTESWKPFLYRILWGLIVSLWGQSGGFATSNEGKFQWQWVMR